MAFFGDPFWIIVATLVIDALIGDPELIWRRIPHPVTAFGALIDRLDRFLNHDSQTFAQRRLAGIFALALLLAIAIATGWAVDLLLRPLPAGSVLLALVASVFIAQRSLYAHVERVRADMETGGLQEGRRAVSKIVGRDPESLDAAGVCRAAIESCAENFSDGVVAPIFWFALFGLPGLLAYKIVNTADLMIGHRSKRHAAFGWAAARLDDVLNLVPARLSGALLALVARTAGGDAITALRIMWRDAHLHRSPNAGWPESAMAGALGVALAGPRRYGALVVDDPYLNAEGSRTATPADIGRALKLLVAASVLHTAIYAALAFVL